MSGRKPFDELYRQAMTGRMSRREVLRRAAALGLSVPAVGLLLAACGGGSSSSSSSSVSGAANTSTTTGSVTASPMTSPVASPGASPAGSPVGAAGASPVASPAGSPSASGGATVLTRQYAGTTIKWSDSLAEDEHKVFSDKILPDFKEKTGITVDFLQIEAQDFIRQLQAQVEAGKVGVDIFGQDNNSLAPLVANKLVEDLTQYKNLIPPETIQNLIPVLSFNGTLYFLPYRPNVQITYWNTTAFKKDGQQPPKTWDELKAVGKAFKDKEGIGKVAVQASPEGGGGPVGVTVTEFIWQAGGDPLKINSPEAQTAFEFLQSMQPYFNPQTPTAKFDTMNTYLANDSIYIGQNWPFGVNVIVQQDNRKDIHAYSGWSGPKGEVHVLGGDVLGIPKGSKNKEAALVFAQYLMSKETQETLTRELAWPAARSDAYSTVADWQKPYFQAVEASMQKSKARPNVTYWGDVQRIMGDAWTEIVAGGANVKSSLDKYQKQVDQAKQKAGSA